jgi:phi13 family phage major tail protein
MAGVQVGLRDLHYAILTKDDETGVTYQAPVAIPGVITADIDPNPSSGTLFADDGPAETFSNMGEIKLSLEVKDLPLEVQAALLGHTISGGVMVRKSTDTAPYVAIGFKSLKTNGKYRYVWLLKGKFQLPKLEHKTKDDKVNFQTPKIEGIFLKRIFDDAWIKQADEDHPDYVPSIGANWFAAVEGAADTTPPTVLSSTPADAATGVSVSANIVITFSEAIQASTVTPANFILMTADGAPVAGTLSLNADHTVVTFDPAANLAAATQYIFVVTTNVKDLAGNALASPYVINFTTA